ncbi:uncharacterized protein LOC131642679 [Vicia villosa]|uniref:uncharacterized protein LOC131642679 n=1 Tax=Vicia villosa TaxID=3911 RepID=UPI00273C081E|nr:uncharacterized protein LOC131642679 [Vicia villosa]
MEQLEQDQVVLREDIDAMNHKVGQMLEALLALSKNNVQHPVIENVDPTSGFTVVNNPIYDSPPEMDDPIQPQTVHTAVSNQIHAMQEHSTIQDMHIPPPHAAKMSQCAQTNPMINIKAPQDTEVIQMCHVMEEQIRALEGKDTHGLDAIDMCLVSDIIIPPKFKMPKFEKYKGFSCPKTHLTMFIRKMAAYAHDDKFLIHCFQDSLSGASLEWYTQLKRNDVHTWKDLAMEFLKHYEYNIDIAPSRTQLQSLSQKSNESFKEYTQRWRELAARVRPPILDRELVGMFLGTLHDPYFEKMISCASLGFFDLMIIGERIESGLKSGKLQSASSSHTSEKESSCDSQKDGEDATDAIWEALQNPPHISYGQHPYVADIQCLQPLLLGPQFQQPQVVPYVNQQAQGSGYQNRCEPRNNLERRNSPLDPIPMTYSQLLPHLVRSSLVVPKFLKPPKSFPPEYDFNAQCGYHAGTVGHSTENCNAYKAKVQQLIDQKYLTLQGGNLLMNGNPILK